jgi:Ca2+-binding EF-hand superfamily protein
MKTTTFQRLAVGVGAACGLFLSSAALAGGDKEHKKGGMAEMSTMDSNGDGKLSADEHATAARRMFEAMDTDKDGKVTATEMEAAHSQMMGSAHDKADERERPYKRPHMTAAEKIAKVDTNGDGVLTAEEQTVGARTMFERMDTSKDGFLSKAELKAGHDKLLRKGADKTDGK